MKRNLLLGILALATSSLFAADKEDVMAAAKKLGEKANYSWKTTFVVPADSQFKPGPMEGQTEKDGFTYVTMSRGDNTTEVLKKGDKFAVTNREGDWVSEADLQNAEGPGRFLGFMVRGIHLPATQAAELAEGAKELKKEGDTFSGDLTEAEAKKALSFRGRNGNGPEASDAKGSVKFWIKEGELVKYEFKVSGKISFNGNDREVDRDTTVEIKDVGTTKVKTPEAAKKKLG
ncbi:MAG TPA: hypothetical protein VHH73_02285 [Verrucomicrobiae bacterium]|nr:hypothetical protein [Verrucomicrobiae bacterium]